MNLRTFSSYDTVNYPGYPYDYTHPDRLATLGALFGMEPAPLSHCRVLELGCGDGANLIPVAYQWPESQFVGIDLSGSAIEKGRALAALIELRNINLCHCDIMQFGTEFGQFDYIIAHGVYSWVPRLVREKMLSLFGKHLAPHGIAYISYNCLPGSHLRDLAREIMNYHIRPFRQPRDRVEQARNILKAVSEASDEISVFGAVLRHEFRRIEEMSDAELFHDDLSETQEAFLLADVVAAAETQGLQYLWDASFQRGSLPAPDLLNQFPPEAILIRDQYHDFIEGHMFRRTLLCRGDVVLNRSPTPDWLQRFHLGAEATPEADSFDPAGDQIMSFKIRRDGGAGRLATDHRLSKAAILHLGQSWPATLRFPALVEAALHVLGDAAPVGAELEDQVETLKDILFRAVLSGHVGPHMFPPKLTTEIHERPKASRLAREQAESGRLVTSLQHSCVILDDEILRRFLPLVDGTRTLEELAFELGGHMKDGEQGMAILEEPNLTRETVARNLRRLARLGLLEAPG
jgi:SAM-dependent methyltransferase